MLKQKRILHIVGARPNFVKVAPLLNLLSKDKKADQKLIHSGQHYNDNMSKIFFEELSNSLLWLFSDLNPQYFHLLIPLLIGGFIWQFALLIHKPIELNKNTYLMLISIVIALIVNLIGNIVFLPRYGLIATAYTFILSGTVYVISSTIISISFFKKMFAIPN